MIAKEVDRWVDIERDRKMESLPGYSSIKDEILKGICLEFGLSKGIVCYSTNPIAIPLVILIGFLSRGFVGTRV